MSFCITNINVVSVLDDNLPASCLAVSSNNISIVRGSTFKMIFDLQFQITAENGTVSSNPSDLSGYSINMSILSSSNSTSNLLFSSTQNRMINIDYDTARVTIEIPVKHTNRLPLGNNYYLIRLIDSDGNTQKIIQCIATVANS